MKSSPQVAVKMIKIMKLRHKNKKLSKNDEAVRNPQIVESYSCDQHFNQVEAQVLLRLCHLRLITILGLIWL